MSCGKEKNICEMIDCLGKVVEDIDCAKKSSKEIEKIKKEVEAKTNKAIEEAKEEFLSWLKKFNCEKWVVGEYKWMPVGSRMPEGWAKVNLENGQTLIQGDKEGNTSGELKAHYHDLFEGCVAWGFEPGGILYFVNRATNVDTDSDEFTPFTKPDSKPTFIEKTATVGGPNNLAAGKFAELWQYKGPDYKKKCMKKCLEKYIDDCMDKVDKCCEK